MANTGPNTSPYCNVRDYGAIGDGTTDDTAAIAEAIAAASPSVVPTGDTVFFPAGKYLVSSGLEIPAGLTFQGAGWNTPGSQVNVFAGSWICVEAGADFSPVTISGSGGAVRNMGFNVYHQSTTGEFAPAQPMIHITGNNALVEHVFLFNPYGGIYLDGAAQSVIRRIFGQPLNYGILIDRSYDTNYIEHVHLWPYSHPGNTPGSAYQLANGTGIHLQRCDNPHMSNIFVFNYNRGLSLSSSPAGTPHKVHLLNADFDNCVTGIHIDSPGQSGYSATMQMANVTVQSPTGPGMPTGNGIFVEATAAFAMLQACNLRIAHSGSNAIRIDAENVTFYGENVSLENWHGDCGFYIGPRSSFAYMGVGFGFTPGGTPYAPRSQFRMARLA
jgi:hypothetical protein